ncbi:hypothetical protein O23A_p0301 [Aeromonas salmonicida]|nr:hypothetical protein O23A_p0301 [Aeromonas salmonicida]
MPLLFLPVAILVFASFSPDMGDKSGGPLFPACVRVVFI